MNSGALVKLDKLEQELFYFNSINDIKIRAVLKPGEKFGTTDYIFETQEPEQIQTTLFADNSGSDDTGKERIGVNFVNNSLSGNRDVFTGGINVTEGVQAAFISYNFPLGVTGTRLGLSADYSEIEVIDGSLETLNITGDSYNVGLFVTQPITVENNYLANVFAGLNSKESTSDFDGETIFETKVGTLSLGMDTQFYGPGSSLYMRHSLSFSDNGSLDAEKSFVKYNFELSHVKMLETNVMLLIRATAQLSNADLLPSSEQYQLGGMSTIRGVPSGLLSGDQGYFASIELGFPLKGESQALATNPHLDRWRGFMFIDHGGVYPFKGNGESRDSDDSITSIGTGLAMNLSEAMSGRLVLADPLDTRTDNEDGPIIHFYFSYQF